MGDLMHALPALTDAQNACPGISFDWVVDEAFSEVPSWHPSVKNIYKSAHRRWKKHFLSSLASGEFSGFYKTINKNRYDLIIDAQNNVKSSVISFLRKGNIHGMDKDSVAEQPAYLAYKYRHFIDKRQHAIQRQRQLFADVIGYDLPAGKPEYGMRENIFQHENSELDKPFIFLVHNASWTTKLWPEQHWDALIKSAGQEGYNVVLPGGSHEELKRANEFASRHDNAIALPRMSLSELGGVIRKASGAVCCDTGLAHLTAIIGTPAITLYGPTSVELIGTTGDNQEQLGAGLPQFSCAPCYKRSCNFSGRAESMSACMNAFNPDMVWKKLHSMMH